MNDGDFMDSIEKLTQLFFFSNVHSWSNIQCEITGKPEDIDFYTTTVTDSKNLYKQLMSEIMLERNEPFEINEETTSYNAPEAQQEIRLTYLSIGLFADDMNYEFFINFITKYLKEMGLDTLRYHFYLFYLPGMPAIVTDEGIVDVPIGGFYSIRNNRIELNIHPTFTPSQFYKFTVHEMLHFIFQNDKGLFQSEALIDAFLEDFLERSGEEYKLYEEKIVDNINEYKKKKIRIFQKYNSYITENYGDLIKKGEEVLEKSKECLELIICENIVLNPRDPRKSWSNWGIRDRDLYKK